MLVLGKNPVLEFLKSNPKEINKIILLKKVKPESNFKINLIYLNYFDFKNCLTIKPKMKVSMRVYLDLSKILITNRFVK